MRINKLLIILTIFFGFLLAGSSAAFVHGQDAQVDKAEVPLSDPSKPALVKVSIIIGSISVTGYNGKTIQVEATLGEKEEDEEDEEHEQGEEGTDHIKKRKEKSKGMIRIRNTSTGLSIIEENNEVVIKVTSFNRAVNLAIKVPFKTSLKLRGLNNGDIKVEKVDGDLSVSHTNGAITLNNVGGTVTANTLNGDLTVIFDRVNLDKPMSFSSFNGDVDVMFPANAKFNLKLKSDQGEIFSDFQLKLQSPPATPAKKMAKKDGRFQLRIDKYVYGLLNGGGEEASFKTFNGDIYLRKKK
ncbi:MAG: DUF4097 domain-containing protein [bacterium]|nr:DUF4097 domain-containing protein [bacterium]